MYEYMHACMSSNQIIDIVKGRACGMYGRKVKRVWWDSLTGSDHLEALGIDEMTVLKQIPTGSE
jgi:hypothetical protein